MGDRGNIEIRQKSGSVFFYTHWSGSSMKETLATALERGSDRWQDASYLARIIFCDLIDGQERGTTGFGIDIAPNDNEYPILVVDADKRTVHEEPDKREGFTYITMREDSIHEPIAFEDFVEKFKPVSS